MFYINPNINYLVNSEIIEWDIKSANTSIIKEYELLSLKKVEKIEGMKKQDRVVAIGKEMRKDKSFAKSLEDKFNEVAKLFIENNKLDKDFDIVSIKRDAIFVVNRQITNSVIGNSIKFIPKNTYQAYLYLKPYEFYINDTKIDIKGLNDELIPLHENGIIEFIRDVITICAQTNMDKHKLNLYLSEFVDAYKKKELPFDYYREFANDSKYRYNMLGNMVLMDNINEYHLDNLDISYNYKTIVLPLIQHILY